MNNEPVAWIVRTFDADKGKTVEAIWDFKPMNTIGCTPLYTHPAKTLTDDEYDNIFANGKRLGVLETEDKFRKVKTLTDEEIYQTWVEAKNTALNTKGNFVEVLFARAILKKASEK